MQVVSTMMHEPPVVSALFQYMLKTLQLNSLHVSGCANRHGKIGAIIIKKVQDASWDDVVVRATSKNYFMGYKFFK